jgi:hypothetical protein
MADCVRILAGMVHSGRLIEVYYRAKWEFKAYAKTALLVIDAQQSFRQRPY